MRAAACLMAALTASASASAQAPPAPSTFALAIVAGRVPQGQHVLRVRQGAQMEVRLTSDAPGEAHLHGYRLAARLAPGRESVWRFTAHASGRFRVEWHPAGQADSHSHGPPLATLEVLPP